MWRFPRYQKTLHKAVKAFSQPINPIWFPNAGSERRGHKSELARIRRNYTGAERTRLLSASQTRAKRRRDIYSRETWSQIKAPTREALTGILNGIIASPHKRSIDFRGSMSPRGESAAAAKRRAEEFAASRSHLQLIDMGVGYRQGVNWFFTNPTARGLQVSALVDPKGSRPLGCCCSCSQRPCCSSEGKNS
jgi:hypothetical protein